VLLAVVEDLLGRHRPHAWQLVELLDGRGVQMDRAGRRSRRPSGRRASRRSLDRHNDLCAVGERRREVDEREIGLARRPARARNRVGHARA
jgi:hypothetical protein